MRKQELVRYRKELVAQLAALARHGAATAQELADSGGELPDPRIDAGTFGSCATCSEPIGSARLRARPETELCIDCMREAERRAS